MALDQEFIDFMVPQQEQTILMSKMALKRAEHAELKDLANKIIRAEEPLNVQMKGWRREWFGSDATPAWNRQPTLAGASNCLPKLGPNEMAIDLSTVKPFDKSYLQMMILHHQRGLCAAELAATNASHAELKEFASKTADRKRDEFDRLVSLRDRWYPEAKAQ